MRDIYLDNNTIYKNASNILINGPSLNISSRIITFNYGNTNAVTYKNSTNTLFVACNNNMIYFYDLTTNKIIETIVPNNILPTGTIYDMDYDPVGNRLFIAFNNTAIVAIYNINTKTITTITTAQGGFVGPTSLKYNPANDTLYVVNTSDVSVLVVSTLALTKITNTALNLVSLRYLELDRANNIIYVSTASGGGQSGFVTKYDLITNTIIQRFNPAPVPSNVVVSMGLDTTTNMLYSLVPSSGNTIGIYDVTGSTSIFKGIITLPQSNITSNTRGTCFDSINKRYFIAGGVSSTLVTEVKVP